MPSPDERTAERCQGCSVKLLDDTTHYIGTTNRRAYCAACCDCSWRDYD